MDETRQKNDGPVTGDTGDSQPKDSTETQPKDSTTIEKMPLSDVYLLPNHYNCDDYTFELIVRQDPVKARTIGFGDKDRRPMDPPPVVELVISDKQGRKFIE